jgi:uncharacterized membrane protein
LKKVTMTNATNGSAHQNGRPNNTIKGFNEAQLAQGLGWLSLGLGIAKVIAPRGVTKMIGVRGNHDGLLRWLGARDIASGIGILTRRKPAVGVWSRVGGDALELALLGKALAAPKADRGRLALTMATVAGVTALDVLCSQQLALPANANTPGGALRVTQAVAINRPPAELYQFWRNFQNLPRFMKHLESVTTGEGKQSHWVARGPVGSQIEWDAEIIEDRPNELIAWRSLEGATVPNTGSVRFEPATGGRGTVVRVKMQYAPPAGVVGAAIAKLFGEDPVWQVKDDLRRFKQVMEIGEVITTEGQSAGRASSTSWLYDEATRN